MQINIDSMHKINDDSESTYLFDILHLILYGKPHATLHEYGDRGQEVLKQEFDELINLHAFNVCWNHI